MMNVHGETISKDKQDLIEKMTDRRSGY